MNLIFFYFEILINFLDPWPTQILFLNIKKIIAQIHNETLYNETEVKFSASILFFLKEILKKYFRNTKKYFNS